MRNYANLLAGRMKNVPARAIIFLAVAFLLLTTACISPRPDANSFCAICGARHSQTSWAVRGTNLSLFRTQKIAPTPISALLMSKHLVTEHAHRWLVPRTVPNPLDPFGSPVVESLEFVNAPRVVNFVRDLTDFADPQTAATWRGTVMSPGYSYLLEPALRFFRAPADGFGERKEFLAWWQASAFPLYQRLREETEPD